MAIDGPLVRLLMTMAIERPPVGLLMSGAIEAMAIERPPVGLLMSSAIDGPPVRLLCLPVDGRTLFRQLVASPGVCGCETRAALQLLMAYCNSRPRAQSLHRS